MRMWNRQFSSKDEFAYYASSKVDRRAISTNHLLPYLRGFLSEPSKFFYGKTVLDLGGGEGIYAACIASLGARKVICLDLTAFRMRTDYQHKGMCKFVCGDAFMLPFRPQSFSCVFSSLFWHHIPNPEGVLKEVRRVLTPGGIFLGFEPNYLNPVLVIRDLRSSKSANEHLLLPWQFVRLLKSVGFREVHKHYFWRDRMWAKNPLLGTCFGHIAHL